MRTTRFERKPLAVLLILQQIAGETPGVLLLSLIPDCLWITSGEAKNAFKAIRESAFRDHVAIEYAPSKDAMATLAEVRRIV